jgi:hypothetical protein
VASLGVFMGVFLASLAVGAVVGACSAMLHKYIRSAHYSQLLTAHSSQPTARSPAPPTPDPRPATTALISLDPSRCTQHLTP